jgi:hypothetical protein
MLILAAALFGSLSPTATIPASPSAATTTEHPGARIKCRKLPVTGSLARFTRECRTVDEWARLDDENRNSATKIQDRGVVVGCGGAPQGC